jgi:hypothetical protein
VSDVLQEGSGGMGAHLKLGRPLMVEVHGSDEPLKFDDLDEVCWRSAPLMQREHAVQLARPSTLRSSKSDALEQLRTVAAPASPVVQSLPDALHATSCCPPPTRSVAYRQRVAGRVSVCIGYAVHIVIGNWNSPFKD